MLVLIVFILTIAGLIRYQQRPAMVFGVAFMVLFASNAVSANDVLNSMSNQGLLTLVLLMLCSLALEKTRLLRLIATKVLHQSYLQTWLRLFGITATTSAILNNTAVVSTMLAPIRNNPYHPASKLLLPLSYAAILGGTLTLVGTSTNLIVNSLVLDFGLPSLKFFDFTKVGLMLVVACGLTLLICNRWLPAYQQTARESKSYFIDAKVLGGSSLIGQSIQQNGLRHLESLFLVEIVRNGQLISPVTPTERLQENDRLIFSGDINKVMQLSQFDGLKTFAHDNGLPLNNLTEVVVRPESSLLGQSLKKVGFRAKFDAAVVAIRRDGQRISGKLGDSKVMAGDALVLAVGPDFKNRQNLQKNFIVVSGHEPEVMLSGYKELLTCFGFLGTILLSACGVVSLFKGVCLLLGVLLICNCLSVSELLRRFPVDIWLIIATALVLSQAMSNAGGQQVLEHFVQHYLNDLSPLTAVIVVYILTWLLTELVTNNAAAALLFPVALGLSEALGANNTAFIMAVAFGASASFISPYGYQTNLMVFNAGKYRLSDFVKIGAPVSIVYGITTIAGIYWVYGL
ncbi:SLC13 family permease [Vibrio sp. 10N]|uniref:SLC13 family permease n=1 Tax=Vibrio sp. 10N TaxID=3058938 RepID=UPI002812A274|nr:SLC13 family permease [Vibrio sp. 10N]